MCSSTHRAANRTAQTWKKQPFPPAVSPHIFSFQTDVHKLFIKNKNLRESKIEEGLFTLSLFLCGWTHSKMYFSFSGHLGLSFSPFWKSVYLSWKLGSFLSALIDSCSIIAAGHNWKQCVVLFMPLSSWYFILGALIKFICLPFPATHCKNEFCTFR